MTAATCEVYGPSDAPLPDIGGCHHINPERSATPGESRTLSCRLFRLQRRQEVRRLPSRPDRQINARLRSILPVSVPLAHAGWHAQTNGMGVESAGQKIEYH